jgi:hypothetical protein
VSVVAVAEVVVGVDLVVDVAFVVGVAFHGSAVGVVGVDVDVGGGVVGGGVDVVQCSLYQQRNVGNEGAIS